jgi:hypothetical protein
MNGILLMAALPTCAAPQMIELQILGCWIACELNPLEVPLPPVCKICGNIERRRSRFVSVRALRISLFPCVFRLFAVAASYAPCESISRNSLASARSRKNRGAPPKAELARFSAACLARSVRRATPGSTSNSSPKSSGSSRSAFASGVSAIEIGAKVFFWFCSCLNGV